MKFLNIFKKKQVTVNDKLSNNKKTTFKIPTLISAIGGKSNIVSVQSTHTKVKIGYKDKSLVKLDQIQSLKGISGVFLSSSAITIITGNQANLIVSRLKK